MLLLPEAALRAGFVRHRVGEPAGIPAGIRRLVEAFDGEVRSETYYRYHVDGWHLADAAACADASYFNIHATPAIELDGAAAARAVCCLELIKPA
jgi:hypothetical protein